MRVIRSYLPTEGSLLDKSGFGELSTDLRGELTCTLVLHVRLFNRGLWQCIKAALLLKTIENIALWLTTRYRTILGRGRLLMVLCKLQTLLLVCFVAFQVCFHFSCLARECTGWGAIVAGS